ncbi:MAG: hypothetical protein AAB366_00780 [Patescibacteria group bacterium]
MKRNENFIKRNKGKRLQLGPVAQKILLLLEGGLVLSLTQRPDAYFRIVDGMKKEWKDINRRTLHEAIKNLYRSKLIDYKENDNDTITLVLNSEGKKRALTYNLDKIEIKKPSQWDGLWRMVIFDIPEHLKQGRNALAVKLKQLGFYPLQKSVFIYPYECQNEIDFIVEIFNLKPYVRIILAKKTDIDLDLKNKFGIK